MSGHFETPFTMRCGQHVKNCDLQNVLKSKLFGSKNDLL